MPSDSVAPSVTAAAKSLRIGSPSVDVPALPTRGDPAVQSWRLSDGTIWAYAHRAGGKQWLQLPDVGSFHLDGGADTVTAFPESGVSEETLRDAYRRIVLPISFQARGGEVLHASAVRGPTGVIGFCAESQGGKSTTAFALSRRGYRLWADDALALDFSRHGVSAVMLPFLLRLRPASARFFFGTERTADRSPASTDDYGAPEDPAPLGAVFFLNREPGERRDFAHTAVPVAPADAFVRLLVQAGCFTLQDAERNELMMRHYLELSASVPFFALRLPGRLEQLGEVVDRIEEMLHS